LRLRFLDQAHNFVTFGRENDKSIFWADIYNGNQGFVVYGASCLVDIRNDVTNKIRLMNPFDYEIQVNQNTVVGEAEKVESQLTTLFTVEDNDEVKNVNPTRRIKPGESKPVT
jgi:hypothetical protein